jgi:hypothetical protein
VHFFVFGWDLSESCRGAKNFGVARFVDGFGSTGAKILVFYVGGGDDWVVARRDSSIHTR